MHFISVLKIFLYKDLGFEDAENNENNFIQMSLCSGSYLEIITQSIFITLSVQNMQ